MKYKIQRSVKWVNFTAEIEAKSPGEAWDKMNNLQKASDYIVTANDREITSLDQLFSRAWKGSLEDQDGYEYRMGRDGKLERMS